MEKLLLDSIPSDLEKPIFFKIARKEKLGETNILEGTKCYIEKMKKDLLRL